MATPAPPIDAQAEAQAREITWHLTDEDDHGHTDNSPTVLGFWIYLMSDALIFAGLFATYGVLSTSYAGGPVPREIFALPLVALNTGLLLVSSLTFGMAMLAMEDGKLAAVRLWLAVTALFGLGFVGIELYEFATLIGEGATPQRSAFLSGFFTLVATHGLHVTAGLIWIAVMQVQLAQRGLIPDNRRRLICLSMFWHFLDIIWIGVFTFVYLFGVLR
ncbi:cytochrome o ubiquinol oxidase subunit III [Sphingomonas sp.]|jgi:cytochrome o ubiquinol oxidase subunit 3|uniref:cytochrome o ubiquinol oxidase subunit III n=1 Tax=Sphingomonas sp. TaxID=28214 RepID=UPI002D7FE8C7|nr:cytochrome o ubiquinol oxidase subunit III [Sphingomonas sp.]HEU0045256.1 cytochrome o ubiquinol oxidase subunit III [Sphingomonas sp.]